MVHANYDSSEFIQVRFYASSGNYGNTSSTQRLAFYGINSYPTVIFNGVTRIGGGGSTITSGAPYLDVVEGSYHVAAPIEIHIDSLDTATGDISATVTMHSETANLTAERIFFVLVEDALTSVYTRVNRQVIEDALTLTGAGNTAVFNKSFTIDPSWNAANLNAVVFVQRVADNQILQAASNLSYPNYDVRTMTDFPRVQIGPDSGTYVGDAFSVYNTGLADSYTIDLVIDDIPAGWTASYSDSYGGTFTGQTSFSLSPDEQAEFHINVMPSSPGSMKYHFDINTPNIGSTQSISFSYVTAGLDVIVVDDDGGEDFESYFTVALDTAGKSYFVWDLAENKMTQEASDTFPILIWNVGWSFPSLDEVDRAFITDHLAAGRSLFLSGQDIGWDLNENDDNLDVDFYNSVLHASYVTDDTNLLYLDGVTDDPISDGLTLHIAGGDGADNQDYPSEIEAYDADATEILYYQTAGSRAGAIRAVDSTTGGRVVYLAFGFEGIDNAIDREALLSPAVDWLSILFVDGFESGTTNAWSGAAP